MPRHYTPQDRQFVLERVIANRGDIARTADELGINARTIYKWRKKANIAQLPLTNLPPIAPIADSKSLSVHGEGFREGLPADDLQALRDLKTKMLDLADYIIANDKIKDAIDDAPLNQRIAALVQLIDRIAKLAAQLPVPKEKQVIRIAGDPEEIYDTDLDYAARSTPESVGSISG